MSKTNSNRLFFPAGKHVRKGFKRVSNGFVLLRGSWVMERANRMADEFGMSQSDACRKAHLAWNLLVLMGKDIVTFQYRKLDGTLRQARGTLDPFKDPAFLEAMYKLAEQRCGHEDEPYDISLDTVNYWDMDKHGWRTFLIRFLDGQR